MTPAELDALEALAEAATAYEAEDVTDAQVFTCPLCDGDGDIEGKLYDHKHKPSTIVAFGIGDGLKMAEDFVSRGPAAMIALVAEVRRLTRERDEARANTLSEAAEVRHLLADVERLTRERDSSREALARIQRGAALREGLPDAAREEIERLTREVESLRGYQAKNRALRAEVASERAKALEEAAKVCERLASGMRTESCARGTSHAESMDLESQADGATSCASELRALAARDAKGGQA